MASKPMLRSLEHLRGLDCSYQIVEHWNAFAKIRQDLYGFGDILACSPLNGIAIIQTTSGEGGGGAARRHKILANPRAWKWILSGGRIFIWTWKLRPFGGARGAPKDWMLKQEEIKRQDFDAKAMELAWYAMTHKKQR